MTPYGTAPTSPRPDDDLPPPPQHPRAQPAPWMPLEPLTELWAAFGKEASSREALLAASEAFAALADEHEAIHNLNWLAPAWLHPIQQEREGTADATPLTLFVTQETVIEALGRAATHWYEAARALVDYAGQPHLNERDEQEVLPMLLDLETLICYTLSQRERVWAIAHALLAEQLQRLFPQHAQGEGSQ